MGHVRHFARLAIAGAVLVCCTDLSGLQGQSSNGPDASGPSLDGAPEPSDATTGSDGPAASSAVSCADAGADVLYCATFDPGTALGSWGTVDVQLAGQLTLDPTQGASTPGAVSATMPTHDASTGYARARMRKNLPTNLTRFRVSISIRPVTLDNDENFMTLDFVSYQLTLKGTMNGGTVALSLREDLAVDGGTNYSFHDLGYVQTPGTWQRYVLDVYRTENGGTASHVDVQVAGKAINVPLQAHLVTPTKLTLNYGFDGSDATKIDEAVLFDDVVVEAL